MAIFDFRQKNSTVILSMLGVKFQKNKNITFLVCNKGIFSREERLFVDSPFKTYQIYMTEIQVINPFLLYLPKFEI